MKKKCIKCGELKLLDDFYSGRNECKVCHLEGRKSYRRSINGLIKTIYLAQLRSSDIRGHPNPTYSESELSEWLKSNGIFYRLFDEWVVSGYDKNKTPSVDRLNDYKGYSLDNIRIVTWMDNYNKARSDAYHGFNNKSNKQVSKYTLDGKFVCTYHSASSAARDANSDPSSIVRCCRGKQKTSSGYAWKYTSNDSSPKFSNIKLQGVRKKISQYDLNGTFIKRFNSISEAMRETGLYLHDITRSNKDVFICGGFEWKLITN